MARTRTKGLLGNGVPYCLGRTPGSSSKDIALVAQSRESKRHTLVRACVEKAP